MSLPKKLEQQAHSPLSKGVVQVKDRKEVITRLIGKRHGAEVDLRKEEAFIEREEELRAREDTLVNNEHRLEIASQEFARVQEDVRRAEEDKVRAAENERRAKEDDRRRMENELRKVEDDRRKLEDQQRHEEDEKRAKENEARRAHLAILHAQQQRREAQEKRRADSARRKIIFDRMVALEGRMMQLHIDDLALYEKLESHIAENYQTSDVSSLYNLLVSPPPPPAASAPASPALGDAPPPYVEKDKPTTPKPVSADIDDEFFLLDSDTPPTPKKAQTLPPPQTNQSLARSVSLSSPQSPAPAPSSPNAALAMSVPIGQGLARAESVPKGGSPKTPMRHSRREESLGFEDDIPEVDPEEQESLEWVMLDPDILNVEHDAKRTPELGQAIVEKLQRTLLGKAPPKEPRAQEPGMVRSLTSEFKKYRDGSAEKFSKIVEQKVSKMRTAVDSLSSGGSLSLSDWNPFNKITLSNKDTYNSCQQCGEYFDMLSIKHTCRLCHGSICNKCGLKPRNFNPMLIGITNSKAPLMEVRACLTCRAVIARLERQISTATMLKNPRANFFADQYAQILTLKMQVLDALGKLDKANGPAHEQQGAVAAPVERVIELERNLVKLLHQFQSASNNIQKTINQMAQTASKGPQASAKSNASENSEIRMLSLMRANMANFLVENKKLLSHYKLLRDSQKEGPAKPLAIPPKDG